VESQLLAGCFPPVNQSEFTQEKVSIATPSPVVEKLNCGNSTPEQFAQQKYTLAQI
jgi:hypothetical protein